MDLLIRNIKGLVQVRDTSLDQVSGVQMSELPILEEAFLLIKNGIIADYGLMLDCVETENANSIELLKSTTRRPLRG